MKNEQLFDLLGDIDDKFYQEAREDDPIEPILLKPMKRPLWQTVGTAAASVAVVAGIAIGAIALKNSGVIHTPVPDGSDTPNVSNSGIILNPSTNNPLEITEDDFEECKRLIMEQEEDLASRDGYGDVNWYSRIMDLNCDGIDEMVVNTAMKISGSYSPNEWIYVFSKDAQGVYQSGSFLNIGGLYELEASDIDSAFKTGLYQSPDGRFWYYYYYSTEEGWHGAASVDSTGICKLHNMQIIWYEDGAYHTHRSLSYGVFDYNDRDLPSERIFRLGADGGDASEDQLRARWNSYPGLPRYEHIKLDNEPLFYYSDYPRLAPGRGLELKDIPDTQVYLNQERDLPKATLCSIHYDGFYYIYLLADDLHFDSTKNPDMLYAHGLSVGIVLDGNGIAKAGVRTISVSMGQLTTWELDPNKLDEYLKLFKLDGGAVAVFNYDNHLSPEEAAERGVALNESTFFGIYEVDGELTVTDLWGDFKEVGLPNDYTDYGDGKKIYCNADLSHDLEAHGNIITDVTNDIMYCFYPERFAGNPYLDGPNDGPHFAVTANDNPNTDLPKELTDVKEVGGYTIKLFTEGYNDPPAYDIYPEVILSIEKDGKELSRQSVRAQIESSINIPRFPEYIRTFEMKDGIGFWLYSILTGPPDPYTDTCRLYIIKDGSLIQLENTISNVGYGPITIPEAYTVDSETNTIHILSGGTVSYAHAPFDIVIDFSKGTYDEIAMAEQIID